jgi:hypothetical protein
MSGLDAQRSDRPKSRLGSGQHLRALVSGVLRDSLGDGATSSKIALEARENFVECLAAAS